MKLALCFVAAGLLTVTATAHAADLATGNPALPAAAPAIDVMAAARSLYQAGKLPEAQAAFEKIAAAEPASAEACFYLGKVLVDRQKPEPAVTWALKATQLAPGSSVYFNALGEAYGVAAQNAGILSKAGLAKKCLAAWNKAVELDPNNLEARKNRLEYYVEAPGLFGGGKDKAYAEAEEIRRRDAVEGAVMLANLYVRDRKYPEAFAAIDAGLAANADRGVLKYHVGRLAALSGTQLDRGAAALKSYLECQPARDEPALFAAHWRLGNIYEAKGDKSAARAEYSAALKLNPKFGPAQHALEKLK